jgi:membrane associated rhomboid family serine protease
LIHSQKYLIHTKTNILVLQDEKRRLVTGVVTFAIITAVLWLVKGLELAGGFSFGTLGILPLQARGLPGIIFSPLIHADLAHLAANSPPFFLLGAALVYYYPKEALKIFIQLWLITGLWVWLFARGNSFHVGASGVVYALASFHFTNGLIKREPRLMAFGMLVIFLYGSMIWGFFPDFFPKKNISWESHLMGAVAGFVMALYYRKSGPQPKQYDWEDEEDDAEASPTDIPEDNTPGASALTAPEKEIQINYDYSPEKGLGRNDQE